MEEKIDEKEKFFQKPSVLLGLALLCTALWGSASPTIKISYELFRIGADDLFSKCLIAGIRFFTAGSLVIIYEWIKGKKVFVPQKTQMPKLIGLGLVQTGLQYLLFYLGLGYTTGARGALFSSLDGFFIVLISPLIIKGAKLSPLKLFGCLLGFGGLVLSSAGLDIGALAGFSIKGDGAVALSSLCFAMSFFYAKKLMQTMSAQTVTGWSMMMGAVALLLIGIFGGGSLYMGNAPVSLPVLLYLCLLSAVAYTVWSILMKYNPVNKVSILKLFTPIFGAVLSSIILKETPFGPVNIAATALVCLGIWCINKEG